MQLQTMSRPCEVTLPIQLAHCASCVGQIVDITAEGQIIVDSDHFSGPRKARFLAGLVEPRACSAGASVLLWFEEGSQEYPVILGLLAERLPAETRPQDESTPATTTEKRTVIEAEDELVLRCGASSVTLRKDGKLVVKGKNLVSRASQSNRIKGGTITLN